MPHFMHDVRAAQDHPGLCCRKSLMLDSFCGRYVWTRSEPNLRQDTAIDNHLQAAADMTADVIEVVSFDTLYSSVCANPMTVAASDLAAWTAGHQSIGPFGRTAHD